MSNQPATHIATSFKNIHNIITRGLNVSREAVQGAVQHGLWDQKQKEGLFSYIRALSSVLNSHHLTEDELAFPYFRDKLPEAPFDNLVRWHQEMVEILDEIKLVLDSCERNDQFETNLRALEEALTRLDESWQPHIRMEMDEFISKADALVGEQEQLRLVRQFAEHGSRIAVPHPLTIPFLLFNLAPEDRQVFSRDMPVEMVEQLVPITWKAQWESMTPYLLP